MILPKQIFVVSVIVIISIIFSQIFEESNKAEIYLDKSVPYIGAANLVKSGYDGAGIKIAVIDTGVDYNHPDLFGLGKDGKVIGGYDFVDNDNSPMDTNGHGTEVAGVIAADGKLKGVAPKSKILAYRVSENGESVSSDLIIKAIERAVLDGADIINISLGVNVTNKKIDDEVNKAVEQGVLVVTAAGNNGPNLKTIGSPGINPNTITVGATYNNITASLVSTFEVGDKKFQVLPMVGTNRLDKPIVGEVVFGQYGRERDFVNMTAKDSIVLVQRGSDLKDEIVYFSDKEKNAANAGAKAIIVYNNEPGLFYGELTHDLVGPNYHPTIPALSMSREEGLLLKEIIQNKTVGTLDVFYHPDFVAYFSSRGPVSPFYIKPDLVAPGAFVNTTLIDGKYNFTSGTSFAAPHVSGAAALLLEKEKLKPIEIKSLLVTTADPVSDAYGNEFPYEITGSGRINVTKAFDANLIIEPTYLTFILSQEKKIQSEILQIKNIDDRIEKIKVSFAGNDKIGFDYSLDNNILNITAYLKGEFVGDVEDRVFIEQDNLTYNIPIIVHVTLGTIGVDEKNGVMNFDILSPKDWSYAKISVIDKDNSIIDTTSATPDKDAKITVYSSGDYWIDSKIRVDNQTFDAYDIVHVKSATEKKETTIFDLIKIPQRPLLIIIAVVSIIALVGLKIRR
jgi:minor extracellular serine protease Vpr